jgi:hypothetical protein
LGRLRYLNPPAPVQRYEWQRPGELVHMDIKKLGRIACRWLGIAAKRTRPYRPQTNGRRNHN